MSKGLRSRVICIRVLMFGMGIQAITPDARDLSSSALFRLLDLSAGGKGTAVTGNIPASDSGPDGGDSRPTKSDGESEQSEEICLPSECPKGMIVHRIQGGWNRSPSMLYGPPEPLSQYPGQGIFGSDAGRIRAAYLSLSFVRLTC